MAEGQLETAFNLLQESNPSEFDVALFYARSYKVTQRFDEAIELLRRVLEEFPDNIEARRELAHNLFLARRYIPAQFHFNQLLTLDGDPEFTQIYNQFLGRIAANKRFGFSSSYSFLPSTNINRGTDTQTAAGGQLTIGEESQRTSGLGIQGSLNGFWRSSGASGVRSTVTLSLSGTKYTNTDLYDTLTTSLQFNREHILSQTTRLSYGPFLRHTWRQDNRDSRSIGFQGSISENVAPRHQISLSLNIQGVDNLFDKRSNSAFFQNTVGWTYFLSPSTSLNSSINFSRNRSNGGNDAASYGGYRIGTQISRRWVGGLVTQLGVGYTTRKYVGFFGGFLGVGGIREDIVRDLSIALYHTKLSYRGFAPRISCTRTVSRSNIPEFFANKVSECLIGITQSF